MRRGCYIILFLIGMLFCCSDVDPVDKMLRSVRNDRIQFATYRPEGSPFISSMRRMMITQPQEVVEFLKKKELDVDVLHKLIQLLKEKDKAYAAYCILVAITYPKEDAMIPDIYAEKPAEWWENHGKESF